jgi:class 3 adenylate cyclase
MKMKNYPYELLEDPRELSSYCGWSEEVYQDFLACQRGTLSLEAFNRKYKRQSTILVIDMTGFTASAMNIGELQSLLRVLDSQKVCIPVLKDFSARLIRCFADDIVAVFDDPNNAIDAAFETHRRMKLFRRSPQASKHPTQCSIGIGYGNVFAIGPNLSQGDEMNRASKLGEDIARANETLLTELAFDVLKARTDIQFDLQTSDDQLFPFYRAVPV